MQFLSSILEEIDVVCGTTDEFWKVQTRAPPDVASECLVVESVAVTRNITEARLRANRTLVLEKLRLYSKTDSELTVVHTIAYVAEHHVVRVAHFVYPKLVEKPFRAGLRDAVSERTCVYSCPGHHTTVSRILLDELIVAILHI